MLVGGPAHFADLPRSPDAFQRVASLSPASLPEAFWLRVALRATAGRPTQWILPLSFDDVSGVLVHADGRLEAVRTGTRVALSERTATDGRPTGLRLELAPRETAVLYLRIRSQPNGYADLVTPRPVEASAFVRSRRGSDVWNGMVLGALLALAVYNLFLFASFRDTSYLWYVSFLLSTATYWAVTWGFVTDFVWRPSSVFPPEAQFVALVLAAFSYAQFVRRFLSTRQRAPRLDRLLVAVMGLWVVAAAFGAAGAWPLGQTTAALAALALLGATLASGVAALRAGFRPAAAYLAAASPFLGVGTLFAVLFVADPATHGEGSLPFLQGAILAEALGLAVALSVRIRILDGERSDAVAAREQAEAAGEALREANDLKTHLLGITAHDLRSPLTSIAGAAEMIEVEAPDRTDLHDLTGMVRRGAARMLALIDDLLVTAALDGGQVELELAPADVAALAEDVVLDYAPRATEKAQTLALDRPDAPVVAVLDAARIRAVLDNVVSNAVKYTPFGGRVAVTVSVAGADVRVAVADDGPGLSADDVANLFQRFRRLAPEPTGGETSTGLGLSIAHEFVALHGGRIEVESAPGAGTTFTVVLPAEAPQSADIAPRGARMRA